MDNFMAQRRMFSKAITNSSDFLMMSQSAQSLYFHFGMNADDDGFCEVFTVMRMTESKPDDLQILSTKGFIFVIDKKVCIVKDWHENNQIRSDRYKPSKHLQDKNYKELYDIVMADSLKRIKELTNGLPNGNQRLTQVRKGKSRLGKVSLDKHTLFWKDQKCHISPVNGKIGMYDQGEWKELNENYPEDCKLLDPNGEVLAIGYDAITQFKK